MADVFLHVGLPKTGTTTIQKALESHAAALAQAGVLFPGGRHHAQRLAAFDLLGQRVTGDDARAVAGAFTELVQEMAAYTGRRIVVSDEEFALARPRHVRRLVNGLAGHRVFVVIGIRDMARTTVSAWQQSVVMGSGASWHEFIASVRGDAAAPVSAGGSFWLRHDALRVIDSWATEIPAERIRVVTVPPRDAGTDVLLERFATAADLPAGTWEGTEVPPRNVAFGAAELVVLRRLNLSVAGELNGAQHRFVVHEGVRRRLAVSASRPLRLPAGHQAWAHDYGIELTQQLEHRGVTVVGDLADLVPPPEPAEGPQLDDVTEHELLEASQATLRSLALAHGALYRRYRRAFQEREGRLPDAHELASSRARAAGFAFRKEVLRRADDSRLLSRVVRAYLDRVARRGD